MPCSVVCKTNFQNQWNDSLLWRIINHPTTTPTTTPSSPRLQSSLPTKPLLSNYSWWRKIIKPTVITQESSKVRRPQWKDWWKLGLKLFELRTFHVSPSWGTISCMTQIASSLASFSPKRRRNSTLTDPKLNISADYLLTSSLIN